MLCIQRMQFIMELEIGLLALDHPERLQTYFLGWNLLMIFSPKLPLIQENQPFILSMRRVQRKILSHLLLVLLTLLGNVIPPKYHTPQDSLAFNEAAVLNEDDTHTSNRSETEEIVDLNPARPGDDVFHYQSMKSGEDPTSGIPVHEELTNAADSPTLADSLHADVTREKEDSNKRKKDGSTSFSLRKNIISSIAGEEDKGGKTSR